MTLDLSCLRLLLLSLQSSGRGISYQCNMARQKQAQPVQRTPSSEIMQEPPDLPEPNARHQANGHSVKPLANGSAKSKGDVTAAADSSPGLIQLAICVAGIYASLYVSLRFLISRFSACEANSSQLQSFMGRSPRSYHHHTLSSPSPDGRRAGASHGTLHFLDRAEHNPIGLCSHHWVSISVLLDAQGPEGALDLPQPADPVPSDHRQHHLVAGVAVRLRQSRPHRLSDLHTGQVL